MMRMMTGTKKKGTGKQMNGIFDEDGDDDNGDFWDDGDNEE